MVVAGSAPYAIGLHPEHVFQPNALGREVPDDPDDPAQRIAIRSQSRVRPIAFDLTVAEKIRYEFAHGRLPLGIGKPRPWTSTRPMAGSTGTNPGVWELSSNIHRPSWNPTVVCFSWTDRGLVCFTAWSNRLSHRYQPSVST